MFVLQQSSDRLGWISVDEFTDKPRADEASQALADYTGKRCRVVELVQRSVHNPRPKRT